MDPAKATNKAGITSKYNGDSAQDPKIEGGQLCRRDVTPQQHIQLNVPAVRVQLQGQGSEQDEMEASDSRRYEGKEGSPLMLHQKHSLQDGCDTMQVNFRLRDITQCQD
jgi:hypothetical protein